MTVEEHHPVSAVERLEREISYLRRLHEATVSLVGEIHPVRPVQGLLKSLGELLETTDLFAAVVVQPEAEEIEITLATGSLEPFAGIRYRKGEGLTGKVWRDRQPLVVDSYDDWPGRSPRVRGGLVNTLAAVPMLVGSELVGVLGIHFRHQKPGTMELGILEQFARVAALALERARLFAREREARRESEVLRQAALSLTGSLDLPEVLDLILEQVRRVVPCDSTSLMELHGRELVILTSKGFPQPEKVRGLTFDLDDPLRANLHAVIHSRQPLILADAAKTKLGFEVHLTQVPIRSWLGVPLLIKDRPIGVLTLDRQEPGLYDAHHANLARSFASQAAVAIENARLYSEAQAEIARRERVESELQLAKEAAEAASRAKSSFLATMSHELRTPMNAVIGMSELLLDGGLEDDARGMVQSIRSSGRALLAIINDVLDFSKIEADRMEIERQPFGLRECLEAALDLVRLPAAEKGLDLWLEIPSDLADGRVGDRHRLRQVLANLLSNAVKFTDSGAVVVTVEAAEGGEVPGLRFAVRDTGVGIPVPRLQDLFQAFTQMDPSSTRRVGGSGLGLTISRRLVQMMGGELVVESEEGRGSTFSFVLPLEPSKVPPAARSRTAHAAFDRDLARDVPLEILVVEDSVLNQQVAVLTLERLGYRPDCASSGKEALARLATRAYDLILMDVEMPGMDGIEVTRRIRESFPEERQPRILAVTASALMEDRDRCLAAGMDGFLSKPIELDRFQAALRGSSLPVAPPSAAESESPLLDPLRIDELAKLRRSPDDPNMAERLLSLFLEESAGWGGRLGSADGRAVSELLHEIRGSALQIGARRLGELATRCEQEARLDDSDGIQWAKRRLAMELEAARAAVSDALDTMRDPR